MIWRGLAVWCAILLLANVNGALRETWLIPRLGQVPGQIISPVILCGLVFLITWLTIGWIRPATTGDALTIGGLWLGLTLAFEFLVGHYVFGKPWATLLEDYDIGHGRIWPLVLVMTVFAPLWVGHLRGLFRVAASR